MHLVQLDTEITIFFAFFFNLLTALSQLPQCFDSRSKHADELALFFLTDPPCLISDLYLDITSAGVVSTGSVTLLPTYQWGGTYSTTNNQHTYNFLS